MKNNDREKEIINILNKSLKLTENSFNIGVNIIEELNIQNEQLKTTNELLESNEYIINKSLESLRNMSWSGYIWNTFFGEKIKTNNFIDFSQNNIFKEKNINENLNNIDLYKNINTLNNDKNDKNENNKLIDIHMLKIEKNISKLINIGNEIGDQIKNHNETLNIIEKNNEIVKNKTLQTTLEIDKFHYYKSLKNTINDFNIIGKFCFLDPLSNYVLSVNNDNLLYLDDKTNLSSIFILYNHNHNKNIYALQNLKTLYFLKVNIFGNIIVNGTYITENEHCYIDIDIEIKTNNKKDNNLVKNKININNSLKNSGILILAKNFNLGGWLKKSINTNIINLTSNSSLDKENILLFLPNKLD